MNVPYQMSTGTVCMDDGPFVHTVFCVCKFVRTYVPWLSNFIFLILDFHKLNCTLSYGTVQVVPVL